MVKITDVQIDGFGAWSDLKLDHLTDGLTVLYGPNEAGKTTLMQFIRSVLYGYTGERRSRYLPPARGGRAGGGLGLLGAGGRFTARRLPGSGLTADDVGKLEVLSANGARQGQHVLGTLLAGIDEPIFNNVFAVGLREVQELGTLEDTEAASQLYKLTSGLDRVSLVDVMRQLEAARNRLLSPDGAKSQLSQLLDRRDKLDAEIEELNNGTHRWGQLAAQRKELQEESERLDEGIRRMQREARAVEVAIQVREDWLLRIAASDKLERLGQPIALPERAVERIDDLNRQIAGHREQVEQCKRRRRVIVEEANAQPINRELCSSACRIDAISEHAPWLQSLRNQIKELGDEIDATEIELRDQWEKLGLSADEMPEFTPDLSARVMSALRDPARSVSLAQDRVAEAKREREDALREAEAIQQQLKSQLRETGESELGPALEEAGHRVTLFRRRIQLQERLEKLERHRKEMEEDRRDLLEDQVLPITTLVWCGIPFVMGAMMVMASLFWDWASKLGWTVTLLGAACLGIAVLTKYLLEQSTNRELDQCNSQLDRVKKQLRELRDERDDLDARLPTGGGPLDARLKQAEEYVSVLEELTPLESKHQTTTQIADDAQEKSDRAIGALREAKQNWRDALRTAGLPEKMQPEHIQQLSEGNSLAAQVGRRLQASREELRTRRHELATLTDRISTLLAEVGIMPASDDPHTQLRQLAAAVAEQKQWMERRRELKAEHREIKKEFRVHARQLRQLIKQRRALINEAKVADEAELRKETARQAKIERLTEELSRLRERITIAIGNQCSQEAVAEVLDTHADDNLEQYWDRLTARLEDAESRLSQLHESRGEMVQEMKTLGDDRRLLKVRFELGIVDKQIQEDVRRWRLLAVTSLMLESIRQIYETERQPETLAEASNYLVKLTEGRYERVWTPLSEDNLRVDNADGESLPIDVLSQGTREAVFISLRLALAAAYARRGALLPLVLDDVLVNFDTRRAIAAADVLRDFANSGHQMLLFTCHHHIMRIFEAAGVEVRVLPSRDETYEYDLFDDVPGREEVVLDEAESSEEELFEGLEDEEPAEEVEAVYEEDEEEEEEPEAAEVEEDMADQSDIEWEEDEVDAEDDEEVDAEEEEEVEAEADEEEEPHDEIVEEEDDASEENDNEREFSVWDDEFTATDEDAWEPAEVAATHLTGPWWDTSSTKEN